MNSSNANLPFPAPDRRTMNSPKESPFKQFSDSKSQVPNPISLSSENQNLKN